MADAVGEKRKEELSRRVESIVESMGLDQRYQSRRGMKTSRLAQDNPYEAAGSATSALKR